MLRQLTNMKHITVVHVTRAETNTSLRVAGACRLESLDLRVNDFRALYCRSSECEWVCFCSEPVSILVVYGLLAPHRFWLSDEFCSL